MQPSAFKVSGPKEAVEELLRKLRAEPGADQITVSEPSIEPSPVRMPMPDVGPVVVAIVINLFSNATYDWLHGWLEDRVHAPLTVHELSPDSDEPVGGGEDDQP